LFLQNESSAVKTRVSSRYPQVNSVKGNPSTEGAGRVAAEARSGLFLKNESRLGRLADNVGYRSVNVIDAQRKKNFVA
jgi:hypothetical protein